MLLTCALLAFFLADPTDALIIAIIIFISAILGLIQEKGAFDSLEKLISNVRVKSVVIREGVQTKVAMEDIVPGDILLLGAGDVLPADCLVLEASHCFVNESSLTGESFGVEKEPGILPEDTPINKRSNSFFMGSYVISGSAKALVIFTAQKTELGQLSEHLKQPTYSTAFEVGIQRFGLFLIEMTFILVLVVFGINILLKRPILESFLFSLALGVGFTPQLLPVIITVNLARGAKFLAQKKVIVKKLSAIENFGSMNILCCDKTGTLTSGEVSLDAFCDVDGNPSQKTLLYGGINAFFQAGVKNPLDTAILKVAPHPTQWIKLDELPFDFSRKRMSILANQRLTDQSEKKILITKGAFSTVLSLCSHLETHDGQIVLINPHLEKLNTLLVESAKKGWRLLAVAYAPFNERTSFSQEDEKNLILLGYLRFSDPLKPAIKEKLTQLKSLGIAVKVISGDNPLVVTHLGEQIGLPSQGLLKGSDLLHMSDATLLSVNKNNLFAEIEPLQKERIILALKKMGHIVGFLEPVQNLLNDV